MEIVIKVGEAGDEEKEPTSILAEMQHDSACVCFLLSLYTCHYLPPPHTHTPIPQSGKRGTTLAASLEGGEKWTGGGWVARMECSHFMVGCCPTMPHSYGPSTTVAGP